MNTSPIDIRRLCKHCKGRGMVRVYGAGSLWWVEQTCPQCRGMQVLPVPKEAQT